MHASNAASSSFAAPHGRTGLLRAKSTVGLLLATQLVMDHGLHGNAKGQADGHVSCDVAMDASTTMMPKIDRNVELFGATWFMEICIAPCPVKRRGLLHSAGTLWA